MEDFQKIIHHNGLKNNITENRGRKHMEKAKEHWNTFDVGQTVEIKSKKNILIGKIVNKNANYMTIINIKKRESVSFADVVSKKCIIIHQI